ncbi:hypothetical protein BLNAU_16333 [Blattamonas nauphoetae]|uniref:Uncharacterized protein n=1 Tax=Blattamonas nauphoetae TaxID=2049346 RepID=A0ABQ9XBI6_9EUKA|nr:hypothetical protein BLNAU_16333 [Blattamonas nauphoetae]
MIRKIIDESRGKEDGDRAIDENESFRSVEGHNKKTPVRLTKTRIFFDANDDESIYFGQLVPNTTQALAKDEERAERVATQIS